MDRDRHAATACAKAYPYLTMSKSIVFPLGIPIFLHQKQTTQRQNNDDKLDAENKNLKGGAKQAFARRFCDCLFCELSSESQ